MSHQATSQLGFKTFFTLASAAVRPRSVRLGSLVPFRVVAMGSKRLLSSSSKPESAAVENKRDKKLKGLTGTSSFAESVVDKENYREVQSLETQSIKDDPTRIEAMTVQELRTMLRSAGVPARGRKCDLVSALKNFVDKQLDVNNVSEVTRVKKSKRTVVQSPSHRKPVRIDAEIITTKEEVSIKKDKFSVGKSSKLRRKISSSIDSEDAKADDLLTVPQAEPWTVLAHKKPQKGWIPYNPRTMRPLPLSRDTKFVKLMSWNVNGLRALMKLEGFSALELAQREDFDVLCLQETKLQEKDVDSIKQCLIDGYENSFWTCSLSKLGYSGTAIVSRIKPLSITYGLGTPDHDTEGRIVTAEFDSFYLLSAYVPNSGDGLRRLSYRITQWDPALSNYMKELDKSKPVILTGDLNCAHQEIDIYNPAGNRRSAGFTDEERQSFGTNFLSKGFVDTFRRQHPDAVGYTYWGYRHGGRKANKGWRLDYFLVSESIAENVHDSYIAPEVDGSDHCPIGLILKL